MFTNRIGGTIRDANGSYQPAFLIDAAMAGPAFLFSCFVKKKDSDLDLRLRADNPRLGLLFQNFHHQRNKPKTGKNENSKLGFLKLKTILLPICDIKYNILIVRLKRNSLKL